MQKYERKSIICDDCGKTIDCSFNENNLPVSKEKKIYKMVIYDYCSIEPVLIKNFCRNCLKKNLLVKK